MFKANGEKEAEQSASNI